MIQLMTKSDLSDVTQLGTISASGALQGKKARRLQGIDVCRSAAIILAMSSHAMVEAKMWNFSEEWPAGTFVALRLLMQMAPVTFIVLFGAMLEIAYRPRFLRGEERTATRRLLNRAVQCYLLYVITILACVAAGDYSIGYAIRCILMAGVSPYADILKFYAVALALAPAIIALRNRVGLAGLLGLTALIQLAYPLVHALPDPMPIGEKDYLGPIMGFLVGKGGDVGAPSVLHGVALAMIGMIVGNATAALFAEDRRLRRVGAIWMLTIAAISAGLTLFFWNWGDPMATVIALADMSVRNLNHPIYYASGILTTIIATGLCTFAFDSKEQRWLNPIKFMGTVSLFTFSFGNVLLYLQPFTAADPWSAHLLWLGLTAAILALAYFFYRVSSKIHPSSDAIQWLGSTITQDVMKAVEKAIAFLTKPIADAYATRIATPPAHEKSEVT